LKHIDEDYSHGSPPKELEEINDDLLEESDISSKSPSRKFGSSNDEVEEDD